MLYDGLMIIENSCPSEKFIYRGTAYFTERYDYIFPNIYSVTAAGDRDALVFATDNKAHALAYVLKDHLRNSSIGITHFAGGSIPVIVCNFPAGMTFEDLYDKEGHLQTLPSQGFKAVVFNKQAPPCEWVSRQRVPVLDSQTVNLAHAVLLSGAQVFSIHPKVRYKQIRFDYEPDPYVYDPYMNFGDNGKQRLCALVHSHSARFTLCKAGLLVWENLRPEFRRTIPLVGEYIDLLRFFEGPTRPPREFGLKHHHRLYL